MELLLSRISVVLLLIVVALSIPWRPVLSRYFRETDTAFNLAVFRIAVFVSLGEGLFLRQKRLIFLAGIPAELREFPYAAQFWSLLPMNSSIMSVGLSLLALVCFFGAIGFFSRTSAFLATILVFFLMPVGNWFGRLDHTTHFFWFPFILSLSPCGDALSVDAWLRKRGPVLPSIDYARPLRWSLLIIGGVYFISGFWKVWHSGWAWAYGDTLRNYMWRAWYEREQWQPFFRIDHYPWLYRPLAAWTILFEMGFVLAVLFPRWRRWALINVLCFHVGVWLFLRAHFLDLALLELGLLDWSALRNRSREKNENTQAPHRGYALTAAAFLLFVGNVAVGLFYTDRYWPIAHYPTFRFHAKSHFPLYKYEIGTGGLSFQPIDDSSIKSQLWSPPAWRNLMTMMLKEEDEKLRDHKLTLLWNYLRDRGLLKAQGDTVRVYRIEQEMKPEQPVELARQLEAEFPLTTTKVAVE